MTRSCSCDEANHKPKLVVLTGGPGAGKTAALEVLHQMVCGHVVILPEAASILWRGRFPRRTASSARRSAQRVIARMQIELQRMAVESGNAALVVCDRGTLDGLAYWPGDPADYFSDLGTTLERELARYAAVVHMRVPRQADDYNHSNPFRIESPAEALAIDDRILEIWAGHPRRVVVESNHDFRAKLGVAIEHILSEVPACCR